MRSKFNRQNSSIVNLPKSHREEPDYLNVLNITDIPQVAEAEAATLN